MLKDLVISMRPKQWYKNLILFAGIVFSLNLLNLQMWLNIIAAFAIFCMLSGSEYIINAGRLKELVEYIRNKKYWIIISLIYLSLIYSVSISFCYVPEHTIADDVGACERW